MNKVEEPKQTYTYRAKPSLKKKAAKKAKGEKKTLSSKIESMLEHYTNSNI